MVESSTSPDSEIEAPILDIEQTFSGQRFSYLLDETEIPSKIDDDPNPPR